MKKILLFTSILFLTISTSLFAQHPTNLVSSNITYSSVDLSWDASVCSGNVHLRYKDSSTATWIQVLNVPNNPYSLVSLTSNTMYDWSVKCVGTAGWQTTENFTTISFVPTIDTVFIATPIVCYDSTATIQISTNSINVDTFKLIVGYMALGNFISYLPFPAGVSTTVTLPNFSAGDWIVRLVDSIPFYTANPGGTGISTMGVYSQWSIIITEPDLLVASTTPIASNLCAGDCIATQQLTITGGTQPYNYMLDANPTVILGPQSHDIVTAGAIFSPNSLTINVGDTVTWFNTGGSHNVNATQATYPSNPEGFGNSVGSGWSFQHIFTIPGAYDYQCDPHASTGMVGTIFVNPNPSSTSIDTFFNLCADTFNLVVIDANSCLTSPSPTTFSINDGSCILLGCTYYLACNYDVTADTDDGSCIFPNGCTDASACNYDPAATCDDGSCLTAYGCIDPIACNYDPAATCDNGSCLTAFGCTDPTACNYNSAVTCDDGSCLFINGCIDSTACNYDLNADCDDGSCAGLLGCTDIIGCNYNSAATCDDGSCTYWGCTYPGACNYNSLATCDDGSCAGNGGCLDITACNYDLNADCDDGSCSGLLGCINATACNYDATATCDDGSCAYATTSTSNVTECDTYTWNGTAYTISGSYTYSTINTNGCDSTVTLNLTITPTTSTSTVTECDSYTWNGFAYTISGTYTYSSTDPISIGDVYQGGVVFYIDGIGGGLVADLSDLSTYQWGCYPQAIIGADSTAIGTGQQNTLDILNGCSQTGIAAEFCNNSTSGGYSDWYLPSKDELNEMYMNRLIIEAASGFLFSADQYWSSTESSSLLADFQHFGNGNQNNDTKSDFHYVRAIRSFSSIPTTVSGCDSTAILNLIINNSNSSADTQTACDSYTWNGITYNTSGTYETTFTGGNTSGCDSTATLNLTITGSTTTSTSTKTECDTYTWNGTTYTTSGSYTYSTINTNGCDSTATLNLAINPSTTSSVSVTECDSYNWNGITYATSGVYTFASINANGCDSTATLNLTINNTSSSSEVRTECDSYIWNGTTYTSSGAYTYVTPNAVNCDSTATLNLTINYSTASFETRTVCNTYTWNGTTYTTSGSYTYVTLNAVNCDSTATLDLTINYSTASFETRIECDSYTWNGTTYTTSGSYTYSTTNAVNCDSTATLNLTINYSIESFETRIECDSYVWAVNGTTYTTNGVYIFDTTNVNGCDSTVTLDLTINISTSNDTTLAACDSYTWAVNGTTYTTSGNYTDVSTNANGCIHTETLNLTINPSTSNSTTLSSCDTYTWAVNGTTYSASGIYTNGSTNANGCVHTEILNLTINTFTSNDTTLAACDTYTWAVNGTTYGTSGIYTNLSTNANGCLDTTILILRISNSSLGSSSVVACNSYTWDGVAYTTSGVYANTYTNAEGCDSVHTLVVTIDNGSVYYNTDSICYGASHVVGNSIYNTTGMYSDTSLNINGCLSIINTNLTVGSPLTSTIAEISSTLEVHVSGGFMPYQYLWNTFAITAVIPINSNGLYWIIATDDLSCPIDTAYYEVTDPSTAVLEFDISELSIYPNPSRDVFNVSFTSETIQDLKVRILNVVGGELVSEDLQQFIGEYAKQIDLSNYAKGIYFLEIKTINGIINKKLMLQ